MKKSAIIIGAGMGGIVAATHLAQHGLKVTVIEKNSRPGGRCDRISREGHHFDTGPTLLIMPLLYEAEFAALGADMRELLDLRRIDPAACGRAGRQVAASFRVTVGGFRA